MDRVFLVHAGSTFAMTVVIWFVQLVHYPLFASVGSNKFVEYAHGHGTRISWIVMPLMLVELGTALWLLIRSSELKIYWAAGLILLIAIWASTFLVQVPLHNKLSQGFNSEVIETLVSTNWIRTIAWTARLALMAAIARIAV